MEKRFNSFNYSNKTSFLHNFDSRLKLLIFLLMAIVIFFPTGMTGAIISFGFVFTIFLISKFHFKVYFRSLKTSLFIFAFILIFNLIIIKPIEEAAWISFVYFIKLNSTLLLSSMLAYSTSDTELTNAFEFILKPLALIKVPISEISLMLSMGIRFIPVIFDNIFVILKVQKSRGLDINSYNPYVKIKAVNNMFLPLMINSFKISEDISNALIVKGYEIGKKRTKYFVQKFNFLDFFIFFIGLTFFSFNIYLLIDNGQTVIWFADNWIWW